MPRYGNKLWRQFCAQFQGAMTVSVSTIIVNYNAAALTARAVTSLEVEHSAPTVEVIVVDNSQARSESETLRGIMPPYVQLIVNESNEGFGRACNLAYALAKGAYVLLLNPDAYLLPGALDRLVAFLDTHPRAGAVSPLVYWDDAKQFILPPSIMPLPIHCLRDVILKSSKKLLGLYEHWHRYRAWRILSGDTATKQRSLSGGLTLLKRKAVDASGGLFDPRFFMYFEDTDLFLRMRRKGFQLYMEPRARAVHNYNQCGFGIAEDKLRFIQQAQEFYLDKYDPHGLTRRLANVIAHVLPKAAPPSVEYLGVLAEPPAFAVPEHIADSWLLEWSPNASLVPAAMRLGQGRTAAFGEDAWRLLVPGRYYARLRVQHR
jgi:GT2 family glycosyltransferase